MNNRNTFAAFALQALIQKAPLLDSRVVRQDAIDHQVSAIVHAAFAYADAMEEASGDLHIESLS